MTSVFYFSYYYYFQTPLVTVEAGCLCPLIPWEGPTPPHPLEAGVATATPSFGPKLNSCRKRRFDSCTQFMATTFLWRRGITWQVQNLLEFRLKLLKIMQKFLEIMQNFLEISLKFAKFGKNCLKFDRNLSLTTSLKKLLNYFVKNNTS